MNLNARLDKLEMKSPDDPNDLIMCVTLDERGYSVFEGNGKLDRILSQAEFENLRGPLIVITEAKARV